MKDDTISYHIDKALSGDSLDLRSCELSGLNVGDGATGSLDELLVMGNENLKRQFVWQLDDDVTHMVLIREADGGVKDLQPMATHAFNILREAGVPDGHSASHG